MWKNKKNPYHTMMHTLGLFHGTKYIAKCGKNFATNTRLEPKEILEFIKLINND